MGNKCNGGKQSKCENGIRIAEASPDAKVDQTYKIIVVGDTSIGKTSLIMRFCDGRYPSEVPSTLGWDNKSKAFKIEDKVVKLELWDTAGQERFRTISSTFYRGAQGIILAYDISDEKSFQNTTRQWLLEVERYGNKVEAKVLIGLKKDLADQRVVSEQDAKAKAEEVGLQYFELSSKAPASEEEVGRPFYELAKQLVAS